MIRGSALPTRDIHIVPSRSADNLDRLGRALTRMGAKIRTESLDDIIDSKRAANRPKDQMALPSLESLRDEVTDG